MQKYVSLLQKGKIRPPPALRPAEYRFSHRIAAAAIVHSEHNQPNTHDNGDVTPAAAAAATHCRHHRHCRVIIAAA